MSAPVFAIVREKIDPARVLAAVDDPAAGASILFLGVVRDHNEGRRVLHLEYEAYEPMAVRAMEAIGARIRERHGAEVKVAIEHRVGRLEIGEASVAIAVSAAHRGTAYAASRDAIEALKREVPVWKKEFFEGGEVWVEGPKSEPPP
ncbi:MAG TPA: molybdenum cofactor biosynthesis protein MoaE [Planctomycetota bacterium]|nr:molybdenum cofactor biosynthesis protein MoaE [Planctomycetota bacterium]